MEIKTAEEVLNEIDRLHMDDTVHATKEEIIEIMIEYAKQFIDLASNMALVQEVKSYPIENKENYAFKFNEYHSVSISVNKESILEIKQLIK